MSVNDYIKKVSGNERDERILSKMFPNADDLEEFRKFLAAEFCLENLLVRVAMTINPQVCGASYQLQRISDSGSCI